MLAKHSEVTIDTQEELDFQEFLRKSANDQNRSITFLLKDIAENPVLRSQWWKRFQDSKGNKQ